MNSALTSEPFDLDQMINMRTLHLIEIHNPITSCRDKLGTEEL